MILFPPPEENARIRFHLHAGAWRRLCVVIPLLMLCACDDGGPTGDVTPNAPPETEVWGTTPIPDESSFSAELFWSGIDSDGEIAGFQWRLSDNGEDGICDIADTLGLPWNFTTASDSTFLVSADMDSFPEDVDDPDVYWWQYRFWQTHTFFVRAIDSEGAADPTPADISFTATTLAPRVNITSPAYDYYTACRSAPPSLTLQWEGFDEDGPDGVPESIRYILLPSGNDCWTGIQIYENLSIRADDPDWSPWIAYDAPGDSGRTVTFHDLEQDRVYFFALQARDVAGAVLPTFSLGSNLRQAVISGSFVPTLKVQEPMLKVATFTGTGQMKAFEIMAGQPLRFQWAADASTYFGVIEAYRYGWSVVDPDDPNDPGWAVPWTAAAQCLSAPVRTLEEGSPNFVLQCRDGSGSITQAYYQFQVFQAPERSLRKELLIVDDWILGPTATEQELEADWDQRWMEMVGDRIAGFESMDMIDAQATADRLDFQTICNYKSVIWFTNANRFSFFASHLAPTALEAPSYNWLEVYQAVAGNVLFTGPSSAYNSLERDPPDWRFPIIFDVPSVYPNGFGTYTLFDGSTVNRGTLRWPYSAWCLEATDLIRPAPARIYGEFEGPGNEHRTYLCDGIAYATVHEDFLATYPSAVSSVIDLDPTPERAFHDPTEQRPEYKLIFEEFYNRNVTRRAVSLVLRDCQTPMYRMIARRDTTDLDGIPLVNSPISSCLPEGLLESPLAGSTIGLASRQYIDTKPLRGSEDFLWGFHPMAFEQESVQRAILWICSDRWELDVR